MKFQLKLRNAGLTHSDREDVARLRNCEFHGWPSKAQGTLADLRGAVQIAAESRSAISQDNLILITWLETDHSRIGRIEERIRDLADRPSASSPIVQGKIALQGYVVDCEKIQDGIFTRVFTSWLRSSNEFLLIGRDKYLSDLRGDDPQMWVH